MRRLTASQARRAVLGALGYARPRPTGRIDARHLRRVYDDLGVVQIDPINVLARAHHQVLFSRLGPYDRDAADRYIWRSGEVYEGWIHVDATGQVDLWPLLAHRRASVLPWRAIRDADPGFLDAVEAEVAERGPLRAADLADPGPRSPSWGTGSVGRRALDHLHMRGRLAIAWRDRQMGVWFDLAERVIPREWLEADVPPRPEAEVQLVRRALRRIGLGTAGDLADHHRQRTRPAQAAAEELVRRGQAVEVAVDGWRGPVYADPDLVIPRRVDARALVNPFDPLVWNRDRALRLFGMDYRIEIYVPAAQRVFGYYALPFLLGEHLVARADLKHDRGAGVLRVQQVTPEPAVDVPQVAAALAAELGEWARWLGAEAVAVHDGGPLGRSLAAEVGRQHG